MYSSRRLSARPSSSRGMSVFVKAREIRHLTLRIPLLILSSLLALRVVAKPLYVWGHKMIIRWTLSFIPGTYQLAGLSRRGTNRPTYLLQS